MPSADDLKYSGEFPSRFRELLRLHYRYRSAWFVLLLMDFSLYCSVSLIRSSASTTLKSGSPRFDRRYE